MSTAAESRLTGWTTNHGYSVKDRRWRCCGEWRLIETWVHCSSVPSIIYYFLWKSFGFPSFSRLCSLLNVRYNIWTINYFYFCRNAPKIAAICFHINDCLLSNNLLTISIKGSVFEIQSPKVRLASAYVHVDFGFFKNILRNFFKIRSNFVIFFN